MGFQSPVKALPPAWLDPFLIMVCQSSPTAKNACEGSIKTFAEAPVYSKQHNS